MQEQLQKVLKELRKARDQIAKLESAVSVWSVSVYLNHAATFHLVLFSNQVYCPKISSCFILCNKS